MNKKDVRRMRELHNEMIDICKHNTCGMGCGKKQCPFIVQSSIEKCGMRNTKLNGNFNPAEWSKIKNKIN